MEGVVDGDGGLDDSRWCALTECAQFGKMVF